MQSFTLSTRKRRPREEGRLFLQKRAEIEMGRLDAFRVDIGDRSLMMVDQNEWRVIGGAKLKTMVPKDLVVRSVKAPLE
jgi:hypothetical protein